MHSRVGFLKLSLRFLFCLLATAAVLVTQSPTSYADCKSGCLGNRAVRICEDSSLAEQDCEPRTARGEDVAFCGVERYKTFQACAVGGYIGLKMEGLTKELADKAQFPNTSGALLNEITPGAPAAAAGLKVGDIVFTAAGQPLLDTVALALMIQNTAPGTKIVLDVWRDGAHKEITVTVGSKPAAVSLPPPKPAKVPGEDIALASGEMSALIGISFSETEQTTIATVDDDTDAHTKGLRPGDVITQVNGTIVANAVEIASITSSVKESGRSAVLFTVTNGGVQRILAIRFRAE